MTDTTPRRVALVTGAARRLGAAIASSLAADGWAVAIHYRSNAAEAERLASRIATNGGQAECFAADFAEEAQLAALIPEVAGVFGAPSLLVNNAALFEWDDARSFSAKSWDAHFAVNLRAPIFLSQIFARHFPEGMQGNIINMVDQRVWRLNPQFFTYTLSKAALWTATQTLAQSFAPNIRVNGIGPGPALPSPYQDEAQFARQQAATPLERGPEPEEICAAVRFILATPSMTGQLITLDGGQHLAWRTPDVDRLER